MVEPLEILGPDLPRPQLGNVDAVPLCRRDRAPVRRLAAMPAAGTRAVGLRVQPEPRRLDTECRLGERRTADIAEADEQDTVGHSAKPCCQSALLC